MHLMNRKYYNITFFLLSHITHCHLLSVDLTNKHIFDGHSTPGPSSMYQLCDITDPEITPLLYNKNYLQEEANVSFIFASNTISD